MKTKIIFTLGVLLLVFDNAIAQQAKTYELLSPDGKLKTEISIGKNISWAVNNGNDEVITPSEISLELSTGEELGKNTTVRKVETSKADEWLKTPFYKKARYGTSIISSGFCLKVITG